MNSIARLAVLVLLLALPNPVALRAQGPDGGSVRIPDPTLHAAVRELEKESPHFARGLDSLRAAPFPVWVLTAGEYLRASGERVHQPATLRLRHSPADPERVDTAYVVIDSDYLRDAYATIGRSDAFSRDLQLLLAHEIYGHLVPAAASGLRKDLCFDPARLLRRFAPRVKGCPTERENRVRADLGIGERPAYGALAFLAGNGWERIGRAYAAPQLGPVLSLASPRSIAVRPQGSRAALR